MFHIRFPFQFDERGRTAASDPYDHIRQMIELVLFTNPGERVNRPEFGCGVLRNIFAGNSFQLAAALQAGMAAALNRWLGDLIEVHSLEVTPEDSILTVHLNYAVSQTGELLTDTFQSRDAL